MLRNAEETANAENNSLDVSGLVGQQVIDRTKAFAIVVIDTQADEFRCSPLALISRVTCRGRSHIGAVRCWGRLSDCCSCEQRNVSTILRQPSVEFKLGCLAFSAVD